MKILFWLMPLLCAVALATACNNVDDDDDDNGGDAKAAIAADITAIVEEMTEGSMARTPEGLDEKVMPHISENYEHAGFDKQALYDDALADLAENDLLSFDSYDLTVEVDVADDLKSATAHTVNDVQATLGAGEDVDFDVHLSGAIQGNADFTLEPDGQWRTTGGNAAFHEIVGTGGDDALAADLSGVEIDVETMAPGQQIHIGGEVVLPAVGAGQTRRLLVTMTWEDERDNAALPEFEQEVVWEADLDALSGNTLALDVTLPDDGVPSGQMVPATVPLGVDAVTVEVIGVVATVENTLRYDVRNFSLPLEPLANAEPCQPGPTEALDGVWDLEAYYNETRAFYQVLDLRQVGNDLYGAVAYVIQGEDDVWTPILLEVTGTVDGDAVTFGLDADGVTIEYQATWDGTELIDGSLMVDDDFPVFFDFAGEKLNDRCESLHFNELNGDELTVATAALAGNFTVASNYTEWTLTGAAGTFSGYQWRNLVVAVDEAQTGQWLALAFADPEGGYAALVEAAEPSPGSVAVH